ncbi:MAG: hypothetical protein ACTSP6_08545 [Promethearchaeota archaeon]
MSEKILMRKEKPQNEQISLERITFHCPYCGKKEGLKNGLPSCGCYGDFDLWSTYKFFRV